MDSGRIPTKQIARNRLAINVDDLPPKLAAAGDKLLAELSLQISEIRSQISLLSKRVKQLEDPQNKLLSSLDPELEIDARIFEQRDKHSDISGQRHSRGLPPGLISLNTFCEIFDANLQPRPLNKC